MPVLLDISQIKFVIARWIKISLDANKRLTYPNVSFPAKAGIYADSSTMLNQANRSFAHRSGRTDLPNIPTPSRIPASLIQNPEMKC